VERDMRDYGKNEVHQRHFFHITTEENQNRSWQHIEKFCSEGNEDILFNFYWINISNAKDLILSHGELIHLIER
jgi:hypothetical protein